jgi:hypothetical protein
MPIHVGTISAFGNNIKNIHLKSLQAKKKSIAQGLAI